MLGSRTRSDSRKPFEARSGHHAGTFVGISDWGHPVDYRGVLSSGVAEIPSPNPPLDQPFFQPVAGIAFARFPLDFERLEELREKRRARDFV